MAGCAPPTAAFGLAAALLFAVSAYSLALLLHLSPLYEPVVCTEGEKRFGAPSVGDPIIVLAKAKVTCYNPNQYSLGIQPQGHGRLIVWPDEVEIGRFESDPYTLPALGTGASPSRINMTIPFDFALKLHAMGDAKVLMVSRVKTEITVGLLIPGFSYTTVVETEQACGMLLRPSVPIESGAIVCAGSREDTLASLPPIEPNATDTFSILLDAEDMARYQRVLDASLGSVVAVCLVAGMLPALAMTRRLRKLRLASLDKETPTSSSDAVSGKRGATEEACDTPSTVGPRTLGSTCRSIDPDDAVLVTIENEELTISSRKDSL